MHRNARRLLLGLVALSLLVLAALWLRPAENPAPRSREAEMRAIAATLACPICQGLSVADSPSQLAQQMRETILQQLEAGQSREQILQFFVDRYGESILFEPPKQGFGLLVWWVPVLGTLVGATLVGLALARWVSRPPAGLAPVAPEDWAAYEPRVEAELARLEGEGR